MHPGKVDYSVGENIYMLPSDMNLRIKTGTAGYNNKILVSDSKFSLGKNDKVNALVLKPVISKEIIPSHKVIVHAYKDQNNVLKSLAQKPTTTHEEEKNCFKTLFDWGIYDVVDASVKTFHAYQIVVKSHKP